ncbi:MAG: UvrD-helicase domain-containing protein [Clostridia bacterium]|nr:UvrD-helicase domain-containing protein [Clostridia bacterium]
MEFQEIRRKILEKEYPGLNKRQLDAVLHTEGPLLVLAGAGSGKTTVIVHKIAHLISYGKTDDGDMPQGMTEQDLEIMSWYAEGELDELPPNLEKYLKNEPVAPWQILAITFTNKAAGELKERLIRKLGEAGGDIFASTFHSACVKFLRRDADKIGYEKSFTIYDTADQQTLMKSCLKELEIDEKKYAPRAVLAAIGSAKDKLIDPAEFEKLNRNDFYMSTIAELYDLYQRKLKLNNAMDFDDLIVNTVRLFEECPDVLNYYQKRFRYILVDEYQDTNHAQYRLVSLLAKAHENLCVVGDDDQSIYKFRGADIQNILGFEKEFGGCRVIKLEENYRSTQNILDAANNVIKNNSGRKGKNLWTSSGSGEKIELYSALNEHSEAYYIANSIRDLNSNLNDTVILYRMNAMSRVVEDALLKSAIPYKVVGGLRFYDRKEIKDLTSYLRLIQNHGDNVALRRIINEPKRGIGATTVDKVEAVSVKEGITMFEVCNKAELFEELKGKTGEKLMMFARMILSMRKELDEGMGLELFTKLVMEQTGMLAALKAEKTVENQSRIENLDEFVSMVQETVKNDAAVTLEQLLEDISLISDIDNYDEAQDTVTLMTLHSAKGLEFPNVFLMGMEEGVFPGIRSFGDEEEIEEERRLCYVGITRAKERLFLTRAQTRTLFGSTKYNPPSRFLDEIPPELMSAKEEKLKASPSFDFSAGTTSQVGFGKSAFLDKKPEKKPESGVSYQAGDKVKHRKFGVGTVVSAQSMGADFLLIIDFPGEGQKKLLAAYAPIEKVTE